jgi:hypothetical protein
MEAAKQAARREGTLTARTTVAGSSHTIQQAPCRFRNIGERDQIRL